MLVVLHMLGVPLVSLGITQAFVAHRGRLPGRPHEVSGLVLVVAAVVLAGWALRVFGSWRLLAQLDVGHGLCVAGPYRVARHPIYLAFDLWAAGASSFLRNGRSVGKS